MDQKRGTDSIQCRLRHRRGDKLLHVARELPECADGSRAESDRRA